MKIKFLITAFILSSLLISCGPDVQDILKKCYDKCQSIQNGYYEMTRYIKLTDGKESATNSYTCHFEKLSRRDPYGENDSLYSSAFHYKYSQEGQYKGEVMYTGDDFVNIQAKDSTVTIMSKARWAKDISANSRNYTFYSPFTTRNSSPLPNDSDFIDGKHLFKFISEERINNISCYHIQQNEIPEDEKNSPIQTLKIEYHFWISKSDLIPVQYSLEAEGLRKNWNNDTINQYTKDVLTKYEINNLKDKSILTLQSIPADYKIKDYVPDNKKLVLLPIGAIAPDWQLVSLTDEKISLRDLKGKLVLLDFFFKSCYPCVLALPALQALHDKYKNKGLEVIGIDLFDESKSDLAAFLAKKGVTYTVLMEGEDLAREYGVSGYPTIYLIDKDGKIIFTHLACNEKVLEELILKNL